MRSGGTRGLLALVVAAMFVAGCATPDDAAIGQTLAVAPPREAVRVVAELPVPEPGVGAAPAAASVLPARPPARVARRAAARPVAQGRVVIPAIGVDVETYAGVDDATLRFGPGWWDVTARPGEVGNTTFAGHRTTYTRPFYDIDRIKAGDEVRFVNDTGVYTYRATHAFVVDDTAVWIAEPTDTPTFTLFACHPKGSERQRYVVKGELVRAERHGETAPGEPAGEHRGPSQPRTCVLCGRIGP